MNDLLDAVDVEHVPAAKPNTRFRAESTDPTDCAVFVFVAILKVEIRVIGYAGYPRFFVRLSHTVSI